MTQVAEEVGPAPGRAAPAAPRPAWDRVAPHAPPQRRTAGAAPAPAACARFLRPFLDRQGVFLGIGSGTAALTRAVAPQVRYAYGIDAATAAHADDPANYERLPAGRGGYISLADERVSVVFSDLPADDLGPAELTRHLREVSRVLVPGGAHVFRPGRAAAACPLGELAARCRASGFVSIGLRVKVWGWTLPIPVWVESAARRVLGRAPADLIAVAWKDPRCPAGAAAPAGFRAALS